MWGAVAASLAVAQTPSAASDSQSLQIALLSFAGAVIGVIGVVYSNWRRRAGPRTPAAVTVPASMANLEAEVDDLKSSMERHRRDNDDRFDDIDGRVRRNSNRIGDLEDRTDRSERHARWADTEAGRPADRNDTRRPGDPPSTREKNDET